MSKSNNAYEAGIGFKVAHKRCGECLLSDKKIVDDDRKAQILEDCEKTNRYFICHKATLRNDAVVCRGFFDVSSNTTCQVAHRLGLVKFVCAETGEIKE